MIMLTKSIRQGLVQDLLERTRHVNRFKTCVIVYKVFFFCEEINIWYFWKGSFMPKPEKEVHHGKILVREEFGLIMSGYLIK